MNRIVRTLILFLSMAVALLSTNAQQLLRKPRMDDTIKATVYADNSFKLYINGELVAVDSMTAIGPTQKSSAKKKSDRRNRIMSTISKVPNSFGQMT